MWCQTQAPLFAVIRPKLAPKQFISRVSCQKGLYLPCVSMAGRALLAGYPRYSHWRHRSSLYHVHAFHIIFTKNKLTSMKWICGGGGVLFSYVAIEWGLRVIRILYLSILVKHLPGGVVFHFRSAKHTFVYRVPYLLNSHLQQCHLHYPDV